MKTITGIENLKDEYRRVKLQSGDLRGLKNRFDLSARLGVNALQTYFYSSGGNGNERIEVIAEVSRSNSEIEYSCYTIGDLVEDIKGQPERNVFYIQFVILRWNKERTEADRSNSGEEFIFKVNSKTSKKKINHAKNQ